MDSKTLIFLLKTLLIVLKSVFVESGFCNRLKENGLKVDFGYQRATTENTSEYYLSVSNMFWRIHMAEQNAWKSDKMLALTDVEIKIPFEKSYQLAFSLNINDQCFTGLVKSNSLSMDWAILDDYNGIIRTVTYLDPSQSFLIDFNPSIGFVSIDEHGQSTSYVHFVENKFDRNSRGYIRSLRSYYIEGLNNISEAFDITNTSLISSAIDSLSNDLNIVTIFSYFSNYDRRVSGDGNGLIIIVDTGNVIKYCLFETISPNEWCNPNNLRILIDCNKKPTTVSTPDSITRTESAKKPKNESNLSKIIIILVLTVIPITILLIVGIILFVKYKKNKRKQTENNQPSDDNENSDKSIVNTVFKREHWDTNDSDPKLG